MYFKKAYCSLAEFGFGSPALPTEYARAGNWNVINVGKISSDIKVEMGMVCNFQFY